MPVGARRWPACRNAVDQRQQCEGELVCPEAASITGRLAVLLGGAVHQIFARFAQALQA